MDRAVRNWPPDNDIAGICGHLTEFSTGRKCAVLRGTIPVDQPAVGIVMKKFSCRREREYIASGQHLFYVAEIFSKVHFDDLVKQTRRKPQRRHSAMYNPLAQFLNRGCV